MLSSIALAGGILADSAQLDASQQALVAGMSTAYYLVAFALYVVEVIAFWRIFTKAGLPGWYSLIPYFNYYWLFKISWGNGWMFLTILLCGIGGILLPIKLAPAYGKGVGFILGLIFLGPIFYIILGFDSSTYQGPQ